VLVACCVSTILSKVRVIVTGQRYHGNTAGECEDYDQCGYEGLHGWPRLVLGRNHFVTVGLSATNEREEVHTLRYFQGVVPRPVAAAPTGSK
jgi:hypothetical protein